MDRMLEIKARQIAREQGYAVHIPCGSETHLSRDSPSWRCCTCGVVPRAEVADRLSSTEEAGADIRFLLGRIDCAISMVEHFPNASDLVARMTEALRGQE